MITTNDGMTDPLEKFSSESVKEYVRKCAKLVHFTNNAGLKTILVRFALYCFCPSIPHTWDQQNFEKILKNKLTLPILFV